MTTIYNYARSTNPIAESGHMRAFGARILARAIFATDATRGGLHVVTYNSAEADCFEIVSVGAGVSKWCAERNEETPRVGQHCDVRSVAADRVNSKDPTGRYWLVDVADVAAIWDPVAADDPALLQVLERSGESTITAPPIAMVATGEAHIEARSY